MVVVDMRDRILDSLSEELMHKMPSSRVMHARCLSLATWLPSTTPPLDLRPIPLDPWTSRPTEGRGAKLDGPPDARDRGRTFPKTKPWLRGSSHLFPKQTAADLPRLA